MSSKEYEPEVDDYVVWDQGEYGIDEGWVYFKGDIIPPKKGFSDKPRYITIETGVRDKPAEQFKDSPLHKKVHTLLLCYEQCWDELQFIKRRESPTIQHYSQYDERAGNWN